jgi:hypothetical protein
MPEESFQLGLLLRKYPVVTLVKDDKVVLGKLDARIQSLLQLSAEYVP